MGWTVHLFSVVIRDLESIKKSRFPVICRGTGLFAI